MIFQPHGGVPHPMGVFPRGSACAQNQHVGQGEEEIRQAPGSWQLPQKLPVPGPWAERRRGGDFVGSPFF